MTKTDTQLRMVALDHMRELYQARMEHEDKFSFEREDFFRDTSDAYRFMAEDYDEEDEQRPDDIFG